MPTYYVEDYEEVTRQKREDAFPAKATAKAAAAPVKTEVVAKVVTAPPKPAVKKTAAQTKAIKAK